MNVIQCNWGLAGSRPGFLEQIRGWWLRLSGALGSAYQRRRQRRALAELDPRLLCDIGLTAGQAGREARKPFWCE